MYYYAICGTCPSRANWYRESVDRDAVESWAQQHTVTYGHAVTISHAETRFDPRSP